MGTPRTVRNDGLISAKVERGEQFSATPFSIQDLSKNYFALLLKSDKYSSMIVFAQNIRQTLNDEYSAKISEKV